MNYAQLRAFHAVATELSFTRAANALGVSQPAVTIQVKALEQGYGVSLLNRRGHRVSLTELGEALLAITRRLFSVEQEADELLAAAQGLRGGHLRVGADGPYFVMPLLAGFIARYPKVRVSVAMGNSQALLRDLVDYRSDVAVIASLEDDHRFHAVPFSRQPLVLFTPRDHPWAGRTSLPLAELDNAPLVMREPGSSTRRLLERALAKAGVRPRVVLEIGSREAQREAVAAGLGVGVVPRAELGSDERLAAVALVEPELLSLEYVLCLKERRNLRPVSAFLALAEDAAENGLNGRADA